MNAYQEQICYEAVFAEGCNRWYDKSLSFYSYNNGIITCSVNHQVQDSFAVSVLIDYIHLRILENTENWDSDVVQRMSVTHLSKLGIGSISSSNYITQVPTSKTASEEEFEATMERQTVSSTHTVVETSSHLPFVLNKNLEDQIADATVMFKLLQTEYITGTCEYNRFEVNFLDKRSICHHAFL